MIAKSMNDYDNAALPLRTDFALHYLVTKRKFRLTIDVIVN